MNKRALVDKIIATLTEELEGYAAAARAAHAEATHEQSRADNKYDTRGLEASYLARGQSRQVAETEQAIEAFQKLDLRPLAAEEPIDLGAFIELEGKQGSSCYFMGPRSGGTEVTQNKKDVLVITPQSPLGQQLMGRKQGEKLQLEIAGARQQLKILSVV